MTTDTPALDFKSATLYAIRLVLQQGDTEALIAALQQRMKEAGTFFENEPVVIDASKLETTIDWKKLIEALKVHKLPVIGVSAVGDNLLAAQKIGLTAVDLSAAPQKPSETKTAAAVAEPVTASTPVPAKPLANSAKKNDASKAVNKPPPTEHAPVAAPTMVVRGPLRSGQRVYARQSDLIVMGLVSQGAEVIADGNIHIYGPLRGKAMAGARGDSAARIFTTKFEPELVAVAGVYRVIDSKLPSDIHQQPAVVFLDGDTLNIKQLDQ